MTVERIGNTIYRWNTIRENELSSIQSWTDAAQKVREVADDVYRIAVSTAPVGESGQLKASHRVSSFRLAGRYRAQQAVVNTARHAAWVHEGTTEWNGMIVDGPWMGPVALGGGYRGVSIPPRRKWSRPGSSGRTGRYAAYFTHFTFRGQRANPWLDRAGSAAYRMPGNN